MMKFFRKYNKALLAVFMSLLLVVWLLGDIIMGGSGQQNVDSTPRGTLYGRDVSLNDMTNSFNEANILQWVGVPWEGRIGRDGRGGLVMMGLWASALKSVVGEDPNLMQMYFRQVRSEPLTVDDWYMLDAEARASGVVVPDEAVERFKAENGISGEVIAAVRNQHGVSVAAINRALQSYVRILEVIDLASKSLKPSEADIRDFVRQTQEKVRIAAVMVDPEKLVDTNYQPSDAEIQEQFDKYKDKDPVPGSNDEFGYRLPERSQIEYLRLDVAAMAARQQLPGDDELYAYWEGHKNEFMKPTSRPTTGPAATQPQRDEPFNTFSEARQKVVDKIRDERARAEVLRLAREAIGRLNRPWESAPTTQPSGYREAPESEKAPDLYDRQAASFESRYPSVFTVTKLGLMTEEALSTQPGLSEAMASRGGMGAVSLARAAFLVAGLEAKRADDPEHARFYRNVYETCAEPFLDAQGNAFILRTTSVEPKRPPASWQDAREQLVADLRKVRAANEAEQRAKALAEKAQQMGLMEAFKADGDLLVKLGQPAYKAPPAFSRKRSFAYGTQLFVQPNYVTGISGDADLIDLCFNMAAETTTQPVNIKVHKLASEKQWVVVEFKELLPVTEAEYQKSRAEGFNHVMLERRVAFLTNWFDSEQIKQRVGWKELQPEKVNTEEPEKTEGEPKPS